MADQVVKFIESDWDLLLIFRCIDDSVGDFLIDHRELLNHQPLGDAEFHVDSFAGLNSFWVRACNTDLIVFVRIRACPVQNESSQFAASSLGPPPGLGDPQAAGG